jgi:ATP-binding cassette subfamily B protein
MNNTANNSLMKFFIKTARPYRWWFFGMLLVGIYSSIHSVVQPYILKIILDKVAHTNGRSFILTFAYSLAYGFML